MFDGRCFPDTAGACYPQFSSRFDSALDKPTDQHDDATPARRSRNESSKGFSYRFSMVPNYKKFLTIFVRSIIINDISVMSTEMV